MKLYSDIPVRRAVQVATDVGIVLWVVLWVRIAQRVYDATMGLAAPGHNLAGAGSSYAVTVVVTRGSGSGTPTGSVTLTNSGGTDSCASTSTTTTTNTFTCAVSAPTAGSRSMISSSTPIAATRNTPQSNSRRSFVPLSKPWNNIRNCSSHASSSLVKMATDRDILSDEYVSCHSTSKTIANKCLQRQAHQLRHLPL